MAAGRADFSTERSFAGRALRRLSRQGFGDNADRVSINWLGIFGRLWPAAAIRRKSRSFRAAAAMTAEGIH